MFEPSTWACTNEGCAEVNIDKQGEGPPDTEVYCGACYQRCEYRGVPAQ
jgi:hypothetical protein